MKYNNLHRRKKIHLIFTKQNNISTEPSNRQKTPVIKIMPLVSNKVLI